MSYFPVSDNYSNSIFRDNYDAPPMIDYSDSMSPAQNDYSNPGLMKKIQNWLQPQNYSSYSNNNGMILFNLMPGDKVMSPFSILFVMLMAMNGADGNTLKQMMQALGINNIKTLNEQLYMVKNILNNSTVNTANALFVQDKFKIYDEYKEFANDYCSTTNVNFNNPNTITSINKWVADNTNNLIKEILTQDSISGDTRMMLINTIYFKAFWAKPFEKLDTKNQPFYSFNSSKQIPLMYQSDKFNYCEDNTNQVIEMDYKDSNYCMGVILPKSRNGIPKVGGDDIINYSNNLTMKEIKVYLPRFTQRSRMDLVGLFKRMGINDLFDEKKANLFKIHRDLENPLYVSNIIHEAVVIVDEVSTEATAATAMMYSLNRIDIKKDIVFRADHPFLYYIRYKPSNVLLFVGLYNGN